MEYPPVSTDALKRWVCVMYVVLFAERY